MTTHQLSVSLHLSNFLESIILCAYHANFVFREGIGGDPTRQQRCLIGALPGAGIEYNCPSHEERETTDASPFFSHSASKIYTQSGDRLLIVSNSAWETRVAG